MKIAIASDGTAIAPHFGRCACFLVFHVENGRIIEHEMRPNAYTAHALGKCNHEHDHTHGPIIHALKDCDFVLCRGMGWRAAEELQQNGIKVAIVHEQMTPEEAVKRHLAGKLKTDGDFCRCHD